MSEPIEIECLTDETFPLGYERVTYRRAREKYLSILVGDRVVLRSRAARAEATVVRKEIVTLSQIAGVTDFPEEAPYRNGPEVIAQLERVYPDARLDEGFVALLLRVGDQERKRAADLVTRICRDAGIDD